MEIKVGISGGGSGHKRLAHHRHRHGRSVEQLLQRRVVGCCGKHKMSRYGRGHVGLERHEGSRHSSFGTDGYHRV